jgi:Tfp pilus assembly protein PilO
LKPINLQSRTVLLLIIAAALVIGYLFYRSNSATNLNVTPDAEREIEKAKRR